MSAAIHLLVSQANIAAFCANAGISLTAIEALPKGGCRVVCTHGEGADEIRLHFQDHILEGRVERFPIYRTP